MDWDADESTYSRYEDCLTSRYDNDHTCSNANSHTHNMECPTKTNKNNTKNQANANINKGDNRPTRLQPKKCSKSRDNKRDPRRGGFAKIMSGTTSRQGGMYSCNR